MTLIDKLLGKSERTQKRGTCEDCKNFVNRHGDTGLCILRPRWAINRYSLRDTGHPIMYRDEDCSEFVRGNATLEVGVDKCETCTHFTPKLRYGGTCTLPMVYNGGCAHASDDLCGKCRRRE